DTPCQPRSQIGIGRQNIRGLGLQQDIVEGQRFTNFQEEPPPHAGKRGTRVQKLVPNPKDWDGGSSRHSTSAWQRQRGSPSQTSKRKGRPFGLPGRLCSRRFSRSGR